MDNQTTLLEYFVDEERSYAWHLTPSGAESAEIAGRVALDALVHRYRAALTARSETPPGESRQQRTERIRHADQSAARAADELSRLLLRPFAGKLGGRLLVVADGPLHYVPFEALPSPGSGEPMVTRHEIVYLPSASVMKLLREDRAGRQRAARNLAVIADPVFEREDPRVHPGPCAASSPQPNGQYPRLRFSRAEAEAIASLAPVGTAALDLDFAANRTLLTADRAGRYRILHLATHTEIDNEQPLLSKIVLSQVDARGCPRDGLVRLYEIYSLHLNADLVVLSGCRTATGREVRGEGLMGLTRGFLYSGAASVIASLWSVDDSATAEVMRRFYEPLLRKGMKPAAALRAAQVSMSRDPRWQHPYYWAAFTFQGDWK